MLNAPKYPDGRDIRVGDAVVVAQDDARKGGIVIEFDRRFVVVEVDEVEPHEFVRALGCQLERAVPCEIVAVADSVSRAA